MVFVAVASAHRPDHRTDVAPGGRGFAEQVEDLRSVYRKAGVAGRGELAALLYGRHYESPRAAGLPPSPYGYFVIPTP